MHLTLDKSLLRRYGERASLAIARRKDRILLVWSHTLLSDPSGFFLVNSFVAIVSGA